VQLAVEVERGLGAVRVDAGQIRQALLNLIRNAAEAMPDGGTIRLGAQLLPPAPLPPSSSAPLRFIEVTVTDTGVGIPPEDLGQIFEPFFTRKEGGTGLGLAISHEIALGHGGMLTCESVSGKGTTFRLTLPVAETEAAR
jgi:signal transduction histidine kinase